MVAVLQDQRETQSVEATLNSLPAKISVVGGKVDHADECAFGNLSETRAGDFDFGCGNLLAEPDFANRLPFIVDYANALRFERASNRLSDRRLFQLTDGFNFVAVIILALAVSIV